MSVGSRLREERQRLGLSQERFAALAGVAKNTAINWEKDKSSPTAAALIAFSEAGADAYYILTGKHALEPTITGDMKADPLLDDVEDMLINPVVQRRPNETESDAEKRHLAEAKRIVSTVFTDPDYEAISSENLDRARSFVDFIENPAKLIELRAAVFAKKKREEEQAKEGLAIWLKQLSYKPGELVLSKLVDITSKYDVPYPTLVDLIGEIIKDIRSSS